MKIGTLLLINLPNIIFRKAHPIIQIIISDNLTAQYNETVHASTFQINNNSV